MYESGVGMRRGRSKAGSKDEVKDSLKGRDITRAAGGRGEPGARIRKPGIPFFSHMCVINRSVMIMMRIVQTMIITIIITLSLSSFSPLFTYTN